MPLDENAQKRLDAMNAAKQKSYEEFEARTKGKPTPTQDELNRIKMGEHILDKEADGSDLDEGSMPIEHREFHAQPGGSGGGYTTRTATPQRSSPRASYPAGSRPASE